MTETEINKVIAENLWTIRTNTFRVINGKKKIKLKHLTQTEVGKAMNCTFQQIQKYEKGKNQISSAKLKILADYFEVPVQNMYVPIKTYYKEIENEIVYDVALDN